MEDEMADDTRAEYAHEVVSNILSLDLSKKNMTKSYTPSAEKSARVSRDTPLFLAFWQAYPRRIAKGAARIAFDRAMKVYVGKDIVQAAIKYSKYCDDSGTERQFIPHPSTWLNGERWDDDLEAEVKPTEKKHGWLNEL